MLAVALAGKMTSFINGDVAVFIERCQAEADELAGMITSAYPPSHLHVKWMHNAIVRPYSK